MEQPIRAGFLRSDLAGCRPPGALPRIPL